MNLKLKSVLLGAAIAGALSRVMWAFKAMPLLIWVALPGWLVVCLLGALSLHCVVSNGSIVMRLE